MAKQIIDIDVNDEKFQKFTKDFYLFKNALKELPKDLQNFNNALNKINKLKKIGILIEAQQKNVNKTIKDGNQSLKYTAKLTKQIASDVASTAISIGKWFSFGSLGSMFGLGVLASATTNTKKSASGIGISSGELRAANVNYGNYISPESVLSKIADVQNDLSRQQILTRLGGQQGQDAAQMLPDIFKNAIKEFKQGGQSSQYADAMGLTQLFTMEELRRGAKISEETLKDISIAFKKDIKPLTLSGSDEEIMGNFWNQLKRSGESLEVNLVKALAPLTPTLQKLSSTISSAITDFLGSKEVKKSLEEFTSYLSSPKVKEDCDRFLHAVELMGELMLKIVHFFNIGGEKKEIGPYKDVKFTRDEVGDIDKNDPNNDTLAWWNFYGKFDQRHQDKLKAWNERSKPINFSESSSENSGTAIPERMNNPGDLRSWTGVPTENGFAHFKSNEDGIRAMAEQLRLYQNRDHLSTIREIISKWSPSSENDTEKSIENITKRSGFKSDQQLNLNDSDTMEKLIYAITKRENERSNFTPEMVHRILVTNSAGSDLVVSANTMK